MGTKKGHIPWNKGTKGIVKPNSGSFKKGQCGKKSLQWKGGKYKNFNGYIMIYKPKHPRAKDNHVAEHRLIVEAYIGHYLAPKEVVHHVNEVKHDNRIKNLMIFKNAAFHHWFHKKGSHYPKGIVFDGRQL